MLTTRDLADIASRHSAAAKSHKYRPRLQTDLVLASRLISMLLRTGVIHSTVDLEGERHDG
jgi:hypothetical protein